MKIRVVKTGVSHMGKSVHVGATLDVSDAAATHLIRDGFAVVCVHPDKHKIVTRETRND